MQIFQNVLLVGCGNMAGAMLEGWLAGGMDPTCFSIFDPNRTEAPQGVRMLSQLRSDMRFDAVMVGVKPHMLEVVVPIVAPIVSPDTLLLSILAGVEIRTLADRFPSAGGSVRIMPNLAAAIGKSPVALYTAGLHVAQRDEVEALMAALGPVEWLNDEGLFDAVTALVGCGPAFVFRFIEAIEEAGKALGLQEAQSRRWALSMVKGAVDLAIKTQSSPATLAERVASPRGATREGLNVFDNGNALSTLVEAAMTAAHNRSIELAFDARKQLSR